jgi:hypothetical protein
VPYSFPARVNRSGTTRSAYPQFNNTVKNNISSSQVQHVCARVTMEHKLRAEFYSVDEYLSAVPLYKSSSNEPNQNLWHGKQTSSKLTRTIFQAAQHRCTSRTRESAKCLGASQLIGYWKEGNYFTNSFPAETCHSNASCLSSILATIPSPSNKN